MQFVATHSLPRGKKNATPFIQTTCAGFSNRKLIRFLAFVGPSEAKHMQLMVSRQFRPESSGPLILSGHTRMVQRATRDRFHFPSKGAQRGTFRQYSSY